MYKLLLPILLTSIAMAEIRVGSKSNIENVTLGEIATLVAERSKLSANHRVGLGGTRVVWAALLRGEIDLYPEYTGTLTQELLSGGAANQAVLLEALKALGLRATQPLGFNNSYAIGVTAKTAQRLHLRKISDLRQHPELRFGFSHEFMNRREGWQALRKIYNLQPKDVRSLEHEVTYLGLAEGSIDVTDLYTTDAEIEYYGLITLEDDAHLFPRYDALYVYREELDGRYPLFIKNLNALGGQLNEQTMTAMNSSIKLKKMSERAVAARFLGISEEGPQRPFWQSPFWNYTQQHLFLVSVSLLFTIIVAVPLGVVASLWPRWGECILAVTGILQTIPSLALLVFMIPFLGIGTKPALVALFLYGLLPILRNTYTGLREIPHHLLESAEALGLPRSIRLIKIELPLASRAILAGIKTSAVINVGTATLGAIIGAGGYGEPILIGIRKDDVSLLLEGAIPAALLALLVQLSFRWLDRALVPKGLRLN